jgi:hypothetical protein
MLRIFSQFRDEENAIEGQPLGSGSQGTVVQTSRGTATKYTKDSMEYDAAKLILEKYNNMNPPLFPKVYSATSVATGGYAIDRELVKLLNAQEKKFIIDLDNNYEWRDWQDIQQIFPQYKSMESLYFAFSQLINRLRQLGFYTGDVNSANVGWSGKNLVLFDFGLILMNK